jgi:hypothetical protein
VQYKCDDSASKVGLGDTNLSASRRDMICDVTGTVFESCSGAPPPIQQAAESCCLNEAQLKGEAEDRPNFPLDHNMIMHILHSPFITWYVD